MGKPHPDVYKLCLKWMEIQNPKRVLAIGDSLETDIQGGNRMGLDTVWIYQTGIHARVLEQAPDHWVDEIHHTGIVPHFMLGQLIY